MSAADLTEALPRQDDRRRFGSEKPDRESRTPARRRGAESAALEYGKHGAHLFDAPTATASLARDGLPKTNRFDIPWLITRALLGDPIARELLIEVVWRTAHSKPLRVFDVEVRSAAATAVIEKLLGHGMLGLGLAVHFDVRRAPAFLAWLVQSLRRAAIDELRRKKSVATVSDLDARSDENGDHEERLSERPERHDEDGLPVIPGAAAGDPARDEENRQRLKIALASLDEREREILLCRVLDGQSVEEIAARLGLSAGRVRAIEAKARTKGQAALAKSPRADQCVRPQTN